MASDVICSGVANPKKPPSFINDSRLVEHVSIIVSITRKYNRFEYSYKRKCPVEPAGCDSKKNGTSDHPLDSRERFTLNLTTC
jgi:hypothetical protein